MELKIRLIHENATLPNFSRVGDAALDLCACENVLLKSKSKEVISTGVTMAIPDDHVGLIWDRSGLAANHGLTCMGGVIDSNYRGEFKVIMMNLSDSDYEVQVGDRIAQLIIQKFEVPKIVQVDSLESTNRGELRFGSSGK